MQIYSKLISRDRFNCLLLFFDELKESFDQNLLKQIKYRRFSAARQMKTAFYRPVQLINILKEAFFQQNEGYIIYA